MVINLLLFFLIHQTTSLFFGILTLESEVKNMPKTDKELTAEIVNCFVKSWNENTSTPSSHINLDELCETITKVHETIQSLDNK